MIHVFTNNYNKLNVYSLIYPNAKSYYFSHPPTKMNNYNDFDIVVYAFDLPIKYHSRYVATVVHNHHIIKPLVSIIDTENIDVDVVNNLNTNIFCFTEYSDNRNTLRDNLMISLMKKLLEILNNS